MIGSAGVIAVRSLATRVQVECDQILIRNRCRTYRIAFLDIVTIRSSVTSTPMTMGMGWGVLSIGTRDGRLIRLSATAGASELDLRPILDAVLLARGSELLVLDLTHLRRAK